MEFRRDEQLEAAEPVSPIGCSFEDEIKSKADPMSTEKRASDPRSETAAKSPIRSPVEHAAHPEPSHCFLRAWPELADVIQRGRPERLVGRIAHVLRAVEVSDVDCPGHHLKARGEIARIAEMD